MQGLHVGSANLLKVAATRGYGADVDLTAESPAAGAPSCCSRMRRRPDAPSCTRSTIRILRAGHGTLGLEVVEDLLDVATFVVPVGGGGLIAGVASAVDCRSRRRRARARAPSLPAALEAGEPVIEPSSVADGLNAPFTGASTLDVCRARVDEVVLVTEDEIAEGMRFLYMRAKLACEPAGAAAVAALLAGKVELEPGSLVVAVVSGGNVDPKVAAGILASRDEDRHPSRLRPCT